MPQFNTPHVNKWIRSVPFCTGLRGMRKKMSMQLQNTLICEILGGFFFCSVSSYQMYKIVVLF